MIGLAMILASSTTFVWGNDLYADCTGTALGQVQCLSYTIGVADGIAATQAAYEKGAPPSICIPDQVSRKQLMDVTVKFLRDNPEHRQLHASVLVWMAYRKAFPC